MPTLQEADNALHIGSTTHFFLAPVNTEGWIDLSTFKFTDESTWPENWTWFGDTSSENLPEFEEDGGDVNMKRTADRKNIRAVAEDSSLSGTINSVAITKDFFEKTNSSGQWNESTKSYTVMNANGGKEWKVQFITEDGDSQGGFGLYRAQLRHKFPTNSLEEFQEMPVGVSVLDSGGKLYEIFTPRKRAS